MDTSNSASIEPSDRILKLHQEKDIRERVFLYGFWEELRLMEDFIYPNTASPYAKRQDYSTGISDLVPDSKNDQTTPNTPSTDAHCAPRPDRLAERKRLYSWQDAVGVTDLLASGMNDKAIPDSLMDYQSLRALGSGVQNVLNLEKWVAFLKQHFQAHGIEFATYAFIHEDIESHCTWFRQEMYNTVHKARNPTFTPAGASHKRAQVKLPGKIIHRGVLRNSDSRSDHQNVVDGIRQSIPNVNDGFRNTCHFFGASEVFGSHLRDSDTISSQYSALSAGEDVRVLNYGMGGVNFIDVIERMLTAQIDADDKVFLALPFCAAEFCDQLILLDEFDFFDNSHVTPVGAEKIARALHSDKEAMKADLRLHCSDYAQARTLVSVYRNILMRVEATEYRTQEIGRYCEYLHDARFELPSGSAAVVGSVAVNCNPITNGHLSLIEYALSKVDYLYILVIEEDKSAVSFADRFEMVRLVCAEFPNVKVLRGGKFVCTEYIAPEYFSKDTIENVQIDFSMESFYFGKYIAPALNIKMIFLGDEPICKVTATYNAHMVATMPLDGIDLTIIPRISDASGRPISASTVRSLIKQSRWDEVRNLVPENAYRYMRQNAIL